MMEKISKESFDDPISKFSILYEERLKNSLAVFVKDFKRKIYRLVTLPYSSAKIGEIYAIYTPVDIELKSDDIYLYKIYKFFESVIIIMTLTHKKFKYQQVHLKDFP